MRAKTDESPSIKSKMDDVGEPLAAVKRDLIGGLGDPLVGEAARQITAAARLPGGGGRGLKRAVRVRGGRRNARPRGRGQAT
jgi:hypothetical protein